MDTFKIDNPISFDSIIPDLEEVKEEDVEELFGFHNISTAQNEEEVCSHDEYSSNLHCDVKVEMKEPKSGDDEINEQDLEVLIIIKDSPLRKDIANKALKTLPQGLTPRESNHEGPFGRLSIYTTAFFPNGVAFGPGKGKMTKFTSKSRYSWTIYKAGQVHMYLDCQDPDHSNWMKYVRPIFVEDQHNIEMFQYNDQLYYKTVKDILAGSELLLKGKHYIKFVSPEVKKTEVKMGLQCPTCGKILSSEGHLTSHMRLHSGDRPYKCSICEKDYTTPSALQKHMIVHEEVKSITCETCGKSFSQKYSLQLHQRVHDGVKPHICVTCGQLFRVKHQLVNHMNKHTKEKSYVCKICGKVLSRSNNLRTHMLIHSGDKPFKCDECKHTFIRIEHLKRHMAIHSKPKPLEVCDVCDKRFIRKDHLKSHMMSHSSNKCRPFACKLCEKSFTMKGHLTNHSKNVHPKNTVFKHECDECGKNFRLKSLLKKHMKTH